MLRDVRVSPDGKLVVYSALGHLYVRPLPAGEPRRLTAPGSTTTTSNGNGNGNGSAGAASQQPAASPADTYEYFPSFSNDGQLIVYTTWNDTQMGRVTGDQTRRQRRSGRHHAAWALRRTVVFAERPFDRVPPRRRRPESRAVSRSGRRYLRCSGCRRRVGARARQRHRTGVRSHRNADLLPRDPERKVHAAQRRRAGWEY